VTSRQNSASGKL